MAPNSDFPLAEARLVSVFTEAILYGIYLITVGHYILSFARSDQNRGKIMRSPLACFVVSMLVTTTLHLATSWRYVLDVLVLRGNAITPDASFRKRAYVPVHVIKVRIPTLSSIDSAKQLTSLVDM